MQSQNPRHMTIDELSDWILSSPDEDVDYEYDGPTDEEQWLYNERILNTEIDARHEHDETL